MILMQKQMLLTLLHPKFPLKKQNQNHRRIKMKILSLPLRIFLTLFTCISNITFSNNPLNPAKIEKKNSEKLQPQMAKHFYNTESPSSPVKKKTTL